MCEYNNKLLDEIVNEYSLLKEVEAIMLGGSRITDVIDAGSDYDIYIYQNSEIPVAKREKIAKKFADKMEINNQFWETGDEWITRDSNTSVDIMYRSFQWMEDMLDWVVIKQKGCMGYTTCFWHNLITGKILYDKNGKGKKLQEKYNKEYSDKLKINIIKKNYPVLRKNISSYYQQIKKAIKRKDYVSINHRISALLESYFDIIFALNKLTHPGEKKLVDIVKSSCKKIPADFELNITNLIQSIPAADAIVLKNIDILLDHMDQLLVKDNCLLPVAACH